MWHPCLKVQSFPKYSHMNGFKICERIWVGILALFWLRITINHHRWFEWRFDFYFYFKKNPTLIQFINCCPLRPLLTFYYNILHNRNSTFKMGWIRQKKFISSATIVKTRVKYSRQIWGKSCMGSWRFIPMKFCFPLPPPLIPPS